MKRPPNTFPDLESLEVVFQSYRVRKVHETLNAFLNFQYGGFVDMKLLANRFFVE